MVNDSGIYEEALMGLYARILRCPLGGNPEDCPLHDIRKQPMEDRLAWLHAKSANEIIELYEIHSRCLNCKLTHQRQLDSESELYSG